MQYYSAFIQKGHSLQENHVLQWSQIDQEPAISYYPRVQPCCAETRPSNRSLKIKPTTQVASSPGIEGDLAWEPEQFKDEKKFTYYLSVSDIAEIDAALEAFKAQTRTFDEVTKATFSLPTLAATLTCIRDDIYTGVGFAVIKGLDVSKYGPEDLAIVFLGVSSYIAEERGQQDRHGTMLKHIMDDERVETHADLPFHTDVTCDVVAMLTRKASDYGGRSKLASSWTVYNELTALHPEVVQVLTKPDWPFDTYGRQPPYYLRAPLYFYDGRPIFNFSRRLLVGHPLFGRTAGVPNLTKAQGEALDIVHFTAQKHHLSIAMEDGDIRFFNNMGLLHGRQGFTDQGTDESRRHVMRLWLRNKELQWNLPPALRLAWARVFDDEDRLWQWHAEPYLEGGVWYARGPRTECD